MRLTALLLFLLLFMGLATSGSVAQGRATAGSTQDGSRGSVDFVDIVRAALGPYREPPRPVFRTTDRARLDALMERGTIRLSARDAIALALENNLGIASAGLLGSIADSDIERASAGQLLRNIPTGVVGGPSGASGSVPVSSASGYEGSSNSQTGLLSGLSVQLAGSPIPQLDPVVYASGSYLHSDEPLANEIVAGTSFLVSQAQQWQVGMQRSFLTGTSVDMSLTSLRLGQNAPNNLINPAITADLALRVQQPLLQGASLRANTRAIHIARNNRTIAGLTFEQQVATTVSEVLVLYYDLVAFHDQLDVAREGLEESTRLLADDRRRMEAGAITENDVVEAEAFVEANRQEVEDARIQVQQQELTLKSALTRNGLEEPAVIAAPILATDHFELPDPSAAETPLEEVAHRAMRQRVETRQGALDLENSELSLLGTREALKPTLNIYMDLRSNALAGRLNPVVAGQPYNIASSPFVGGLDSVLDQLWTGSYPAYDLGFTLNLPLRNRAARADMMRDQLDFEQQQIATRRMENGIRLEAMRTQLALLQAKRSYQGSVHLRELREASLGRQRRMFDLGDSTVEQLMDAQRELELSRQQEITARNTYTRAIINMDLVLNDTLRRNHIVIDNFMASGDASGRSSF